MKATVSVTPQAELQILETSAWWRANRSSAKDLFDDGIARPIALLSEAPDIGKRYTRTGIPGLRRTLLIGCRYHLYYVHDAAARNVIVLAVWSAVRRRGPSIQKI